LVIAGRRLLAAEDEAGLHGLVAQLIGQQLVHADAAAELRAFLKLSAGENITRLARMDADADSGAVEKSADDVQLALQRRHRLERFAQLHIGATPLGPPVVRVDATGLEQRGEAKREYRRLAGRGRL